MSTKPWGYALHRPAQPLQLAERALLSSAQPQPSPPPSLTSPSSTLVSPRASKVNRQFGSFALAQKLIEAEQAQHAASHPSSSTQALSSALLDPDAVVPLVWESDESAESSTRTSAHASPRLRPRQLSVNTRTSSSRAEAAEHHAAASASPAARAAHSRSPSAVTSPSSHKPALAYVKPLKPETIDRLKSRLDQLPPPIAPHPLSPHAGKDPVLSRSHHAFLPVSGALVSSTSTTSLPPPLIDVSGLSAEEVALNAAIAAAAAERHTVASSLPRRSMATQMPVSRSHQLQTELLALIRPLANQQAAGNLTALSHDTIAQMKRLARELRNAGSNLGVDASLADSETDGRYPASLREMAQQEPLSSFEATTAPLLELLAPHVQSTLSVLSEASRKRREQLESLKPWQHAPAFQPPSASALVHFADQTQQLKYEREQEAARAALAAEEKQQHARRDHSPSRTAVAATAAPINPAYATSLSLSLAAQSLAGSASGHAGSKWSRKSALLPKESRRVPYQSHVTSLKRQGRVERAEAAMPPEPPTGQPQPSRPEETKEAAGKDGRGLAHATHVLVHDQLFVDDVKPAALMRAGLANFEEVVSDQLYNIAERAPSNATATATAAAAATSVTSDVLPFPTRTGSREGFSIRSRSRSRGTKDGSVSPTRASHSPPKALQFRNRSNPQSREVVSPLRPAPIIEHFPLPGSPNERAAAGVTPSPAGSTANTPLPGSSRHGVSRTPTGGDGFLSSLLEEILPDIALWRAQQQKEEIKRRRREQREKARLQAAKLQEEQQQAEKQEEQRQQEEVEQAEKPIAETNPSVVDRQPSSTLLQDALQTAVVLLADGTQTIFTPTPAPLISAVVPASSNRGSIESVAATANAVSAFASVPLPSAAAPDVLTIDHVGSDEFAALSTTMHSGSSLSLEITSGVRRELPEEDRLGAALVAAAVASEKESAEMGELIPISEDQTTAEAIPASIAASARSSLSKPLLSPRNLSRVVSQTALPPAAVNPAAAAPAVPISGATAISKRRTLTSEMKRTFLALNLQPLLAAVPAAPGQAETAAPLVIDLKAEAEKLRFREQLRMQQLEAKRQSGADTELDPDPSQVQQGEPQSLSARVMNRRSSTDAILSSSASSASLADTRVHRSYTYSLVNPQTQSKLVEILQSMPPPQTGSQSARAVMYGGSERLILPRTTYRSNHSAFSRSFVPVTVQSMRPRLPSVETTAESSVPSVRLPAVFSANAAAHAFQNLVSARSRAMLQLRRLHAEFLALKSPDDPAHHTPLRLRLHGLPRLQSRLAAQLVDCRVQCNDMSAALEQPELPTLVAQRAAARQQLQQDTQYLLEVQELLARS